MAVEKEVKPMTFRMAKTIGSVASAILIVVSIVLWMDQERTPAQDITLGQVIIDMDQYDRIQGKAENELLTGSDVELEDITYSGTKAMVRMDLITTKFAAVPKDAPLKPAHVAPPLDATTGLLELDYHWSKSHWEQFEWKRGQWKLSQVTLDIEGLDDDHAALGWKVNPQ